MQQLLDVPQVWTYADLDVLPQTDVDWRCYQIVDGALVVSPMAGLEHEMACSLLRDVLGRAASPGLLVLSQLAVDLNPSYLVPDVLVLSRELLKTKPNPIPPDEVFLVVEVVSPSSRTMDRVTKPAQYAAAGIPAYWRVETQPEVSLSVYELAEGAGVYTEVGTWNAGQTAQLSVPFAVTVPIDAISPERQRRG